MNKHFYNQGVFMDDKKVYFLIGLSLGISLSVLVFNILILLGFISL